jgi:hypothetical protein
MNPPAWIIGLLLVLFYCSPAQAATCITREEEQHVRRLIDSAFDQAFVNQTMVLFNIWLRDYAPEPERGRLGLQTNIDAYLRARRYKWEPPLCVK